MSARDRWAAIGDCALRQMRRRMQTTPGLAQFVGGTGPRGGWCAYAARSMEHAEAMHRQRMRRLIRKRRASDALDPPPPHRANPYCPNCASPCGTTDETEGGDWVTCAFCAHDWHSAEDRAQAEAADAAYARYREEEAQRGRDAALLGPELLAVNARLLEQQQARAAAYRKPSQLPLLG